MKILNKIIGALILLIGLATNAQEFSVLDGTTKTGTITFLYSPYQTNYINLTNIIINTNIITQTNMVKTTNYVNYTNIVYVTNTSPVTNFILTVEAESGATVSPFVKASTYIYQQNETSFANSGKATYSFSVPINGNYLISLLVNAPNEGANSLFVNIDSAPTDPFSIFDIPVTTSFQNRIVSWRGDGTYNSSQFVPKTFILSAGNHYLSIYGREGGVQIDKITITKQ